MFCLRCRCNRILLDIMSVDLFNIIFANPYRDSSIHQKDHCDLHKFNLLNWFLLRRWQWFGATRWNDPVSTSSTTTTSTTIWNSKYLLSTRSWSHDDTLRRANHKVDTQYWLQGGLLLYQLGLVQVRVFCFLIVKRLMRGFGCSPTAPTLASSLDFGVLLFQHPKSNCFKFSDLLFEKQSLLWFKV